MEFFDEIFGTVVNAFQMPELSNRDLHSALDAFEVLVRRGSGPALEFAVAQGDFFLELMRDDSKSKIIREIIACILLNVSALTGSGPIRELLLWFPFRRATPMVAFCVFAIAQIANANAEVRWAAVAALVRFFMGTPQRIKQYKMADSMIAALEQQFVAIAEPVFDNLPLLMESEDPQTAADSGTESITWLRIRAVFDRVMSRRGV
jgi:hypothetical protein